MLASGLVCSESAGQRPFDRPACVVEKINEFTLICKGANKAKSEQKNVRATKS